MPAAPLPLTPTDLIPNKTIEQELNALSLPPPANAAIVFGPTSDGSYELSSSVDLGVCAPGVQPSPTEVPIYFCHGTSTLTGTIEIATASNSGFSAQVISAALRENPTVLACTSNTPPGIIVGSGATNTFSFVGTKLSPTPALPGAPYQLPPNPPGLLGAFLQINWVAPQTPIPEVWSATVTLSWTGDVSGSTTLAVTGTTTQIFLSVATPQPVAITAGGDATVSLQVHYDTVDPATISFDVGPSNVFGFPELAGLTIQPTTLSMPADDVKAATPKTGLGKPGQLGVVPSTGDITVLNVHRVGTVNVSVSAAITTVPGNNQAGSIQVASAALPAKIAGPIPTKVLFNIAPAPITVTFPSSPITLVAGASTKFQYAIKCPGAQTTLTFGAATATYQSPIPAGGSASGAAKVTVTIANPLIGVDTDIGTNGSATCQVSAPKTVGSTAVLGGVVKVSLPWTAYNGALSGTVTFEVTLLPFAVVTQGPINENGLTGNYMWALNVDGYSDFSGTLGASGIVFENDYAAIVTSSAVNSQKVPLVATSTGTIGNVLNIGGASTSWSFSGLWNGSGCWMDTSDHDTIVSTWADICASSVSVNANASVDTGDAILGVLLAGLAAPAAIVVVAVENVITCAATYLGDESIIGHFGDGILDCSDDDQDPDGEGEDDDGE
jgi:hypothetical protein